MAVVVHICTCTHQQIYLSEPHMNVKAKDGLAAEVATMTFGAYQRSW